MISLLFTLIRLLSFRSRRSVGSAAGAAEAAGSKVLRQGGRQDEEGLMILILFRVAPFPIKVPQRRVQTA